MKVTRVKIALASFATLALGVTALSPAQAATRSTVIYYETNKVVGFNCSVTGSNNTTCSNIGYLTGSGFNYYNDKKALVTNPTFGSYKVTKNSPSDFRVTYTVNPGRVWSDGVPITGVDLLLSHVVSSNQYSIDAGLGDPKSKSAKPVFDSLGYGGTYTENVVGDPELSSDQMSVTIRYKKPIADWALYGPGPSPVHTLIQMADGKKALGTVAEGVAAKAEFLAAFQAKDTATLKKLGAIWSKDYTITTVNSSTNPLLFVSNGGYIVDSAVKDTSVTMKVNPKYNSGPALQGKIDTVQVKFFTDGNAAAQALANGELDIYNGQATADGLAALKAIKGVKVIGGKSATYEHWDLHYDTVPGEDPYTGLFSVKDGAKSLALRKAFLLAIPRQEILDKLITPINGDNTVIRSTWLAPGAPGYDKLIASNGSAYYVEGDQNFRNKRALGLIQRYYPNVLKQPLKVRVLVPGNNPRRAAEFALVKANMIKVGFDLQGDVQNGWGGLLGTSKYDAYFFGWAPTTVTQKNSCENFTTDGGNNILGWSNKTVDDICKTLSTPMSDTLVLNKYIQMERLINADAITAGVFIHPAITAVNENLQNVKPSPLSPNIVWNYWEWTY